MGFENFISKEHDIVVTRLHGNLKSEELLDYLTEVGNMEGFYPEIRQFVDASRVEMFNINYETVQQMVSINPFAKDAVRVFFITDKLGQCYAKMFKNLTDFNSISMIVTSDIDRASEILEISKETLGEFSQKDIFSVND